MYDADTIDCHQNFQAACVLRNLWAEKNPDRMQGVQPGKWQRQHNENFSPKCIVDLATLDQDMVNECENTLSSTTIV